MVTQKLTIRSKQSRSVDRVEYNAKRHDTEEKLYTHTDPEAVQTYEITTEREQRFEKIFSCTLCWRKKARLKAELGIRSKSLPGIDNIEDPDFDDGTDNFDLVTVGSESGLNQFEFPPDTPELRVVREFAVVREPVVRPSSAVQGRELELVETTL